MPEECRDEVLDSVDMGSEGLNKSRNAKLLAIIDLGLRQLVPSKAVRFEQLLSDYDIQAVHEIIKRFGAACALFAFMFCLIVSEFHKAKNHESDYARRRPSRSRRVEDHFEPEPIEESEEHVFA